MTAVTVVVMGAGGGPADDLQPENSPIKSDATPRLRQILSQIEFADKIVAVLQGQLATRMRLDSITSALRPDADIVLAPRPTAGTTCSALLAVDHIDPQHELLLVDANEPLGIDFAEVVKTFRMQGFDAGTIECSSLRQPDHDAPMSAKKVGEEVSEEESKSLKAIEGFFWWRRAGDFISCATTTIRTGGDVKGRFEIWRTLNEMVKLGKRVGLLRIDGAACHPQSTEVASRAFRNGGRA